jgi:AcrR family transcriptional regulator
LKKPQHTAQPASRKQTRKSSKPRDAQLAIFETAERLCGEFGLEAVSVRDIATAAPVNLSAINYYYGSRINLLVTIVQTRGLELASEREQLLEKARQSDPPDLREILRAVLTPMSHWREPGSNRRAALQFLTRTLTAATPELKQVIDAGVLEFRGIIDLLQRALPKLSRADLCWRFHFMMSIEHMNVWDVERLDILSAGQCRADDQAETLERALDFSMAGFLAPPRKIARVRKRR